MNTRVYIRRIAIMAAFLVGAFSIASCSKDYATSTSDSHVCVFDGSERGGQKLKFQVPPGAESKEIDNNDKVIKIPASNRFYMASTNDATRDPLAPRFYEGFAKGSVKVRIEGQLRFRFNLKLACEWYSQHGRRNADSNGDLKFNARGDDARRAGWLKFLAENFGVTMQEVTSETVGVYSWPALVYNYPANADEAGVLPPGAKAQAATNIALGVELGKNFTERLNANLGGEYFCGIETTDRDTCPPMRFQVITVHAADPALEQSRQAFEAKRQDLRNQELEGELLAQRQASVIASEKAEQAILAEQLNTADLKARIATAKCRAIAAVNPNLDCDGKAPAIVVGN